MFAVIISRHLVCSKCTINSSSCYSHTHIHTHVSLKRNIATFYSTLSIGIVFLSVTQVLSPSLALLSTQLPNLIAASFTSLRFHFIATTTRFSNLKYCNSFWTAIPASDFSHSNPSFVVGKDTCFLTTWTPTVHIPYVVNLSFLSRGPKSIISFHYPVLQPCWFIPHARKKLSAPSLFFCLKSPYQLKPYLLSCLSFSFYPSNISHYANSRRSHVDLIHICHKNKYCIALFYDLTCVHILYIPWRALATSDSFLVCPPSPRIMTNKMVGIREILRTTIVSSLKYSVSFFNSIQHHFLVLMHSV